MRTSPAPSLPIQREKTVTALRSATSTRPMAGASSRTTMSDQEKRSQSPLPTPSPSRNVPPRSSAEATALPKPNIPSVRSPSLTKPQALLTFIVGEEKKEQTFVVHKDFATFYSQSFKDAFNEKSKSTEAETLKMKLPYCSTSNFGIIVHWLYTKQIVHGEKAHLSLHELATLWRLADQLKIYDMQDHIIAEIIRLIKFYYEDESLNAKRSFLFLAFTSSGDGPLKKLAVEMLAWGTEPEALATMRNELNNIWGGSEWLSELWAEVATTFSKHYWDRIPGKYVREWGVVEDYSIGKSVQ